MSNIFAPDSICYDIDISVACRVDARRLVIYINVCEGSFGFAIWFYSRPVVAIVIFRLDRLRAEILFYVEVSLK